ncbi:MAG: adenylyl-sulfate kinase [Gammaproteobacteria bacterium]|nr:adenylyl-sulfate kinase [Gammaproteobacteria bacterium]MDH5778426.1 adenylyl-sulfate kinase [Gammaproteobacteria bacterium]
MYQEQPAENVIWQQHIVSRKHREEQTKQPARIRHHKGAVIWLTGLSGSGKSTIACALEHKLHKNGYRTFILDGDNVRHGLSRDLGFSIDDRAENIRRIGEVARLFVEAGVLTITAFISPLRSERDQIRQLFKQNDFFEIYCQCPIETCEQRDVKGLYKKARAGKIPQFTGINSPYEPPANPELLINTMQDEVPQSVARIETLLKQQNIIN